MRHHWWVRKIWIMYNVLNIRVLRCTPIKPHYTYYTIFSCVFICLMTGLQNGWPADVLHQSDDEHHDQTAQFTLKQQLASIYEQRTTIKMPFVFDLLNWKYIYFYPSWCVVIISLISLFGPNAVSLMSI